jgi:transposase
MLFASIKAIAFERLLPRVRRRPPLVAAGRRLLAYLRLHAPARRLPAATLPALFLRLSLLRHCCIAALPHCRYSAIRTRNGAFPAS